MAATSFSLARRSTVELLLLRHADPNIQDDCGFTPLIVSSIVGSLRGVMLLLDHGARKDILSGEGMDARAHAVANEQFGIARVLAKHRPRKPLRPNREEGSSIYLASDSSASSAFSSFTTSSEGSLSGSVPLQLSDCDAVAEELLAADAAEKASSAAAAEKARRRRARKRLAKERASTAACREEVAPAGESAMRGGNAFSLEARLLVAPVPVAPPVEAEATSAGKATPPLNAVAAPPAVPADFVCPIGLQLMVDPVVAADGTTYDRACIERWLHDHETSPMTNAPLGSAGLVPNNMARSLIRSFVDANPTLEECEECMERLRVNS